MEACVAIQSVAARCSRRVRGSSHSVPTLTPVARRAIGPCAGATTHAKARHYSTPSTTEVVAIHQHCLRLSLCAHL